MSPPPMPVVKPSRNQRSLALSLPPRCWGVNLPDIPTALAHPPPLPRDGAITPDHRKRPRASTTAASTFTTVAGRNTTPLNGPQWPHRPHLLRRTCLFYSTLRTSHMRSQRARSQRARFSTPLRLTPMTKRRVLLEMTATPSPYSTLAGYSLSMRQLTRLSIPSLQTTGSLRRQLPGSPKPIVHSIWLSLGSPQLSMTTTTMSPMPPQWRC